MMLMAVDYGYPNARIRAMKSRLFDRIYYDKLLQMDDVHEIIAALEQTPYKKDIEEGTLKAPGVVGVEEGLRRNIVSDFQKVLKITDGEARQLVKILLGRWDVQNIKTILRGKHTGVSSEDIISSLIPAGELSETLLLQLEKQPDIKAVIDMLAIWKVHYHQPLTHNFPQYARTRNLAQLELELDRFYYTDALEKTTRRSLNVQLIREIIMREVDFVNIMTLIRLTREKVDKEDIASFYIGGGKHIDDQMFYEMAKEKGPEDIVAALQRTPYQEALNQGLAKYAESGDLSVIERSMEDMIIRKSIQMFAGDPLSIALIIGYISAKFNEIVNLRVIVRGKSVGMPEEKIREGLVIV